ncbi:MAG: hypothetical protein PHY62_05910 [Gallionella sp.]|nr:hypothetical protein [Gallionella sp.]
MKRLLTLFISVFCLFSNSMSYASTIALAREFHLSLIKIEDEVLPNQVAAATLMLHPELREKESELRRITHEILLSKEFENVRAEYFSKVFSQQELRSQIALVRNPAFKLYYKKSTEMLQFSGAALLPFLRESFAQLDEQPVKQTAPNKKSNRLTFYSEDLGNFFIGAWLFFDQESERLYRTSFSNKIQGSAYSHFLFCAAQKIAISNGFDRLSIIEDEKNKQHGIIGFLKPGEDVKVTLDARFLDSDLINITNTEMTSLCIKK